jgi:thymidylate synthase
MLALTELQKMIAEQLKVEIGTYLDYTNSAHIYEKTYRDVEHFTKVLKKRLSKDI